MFRHAIVDVDDIPFEKIPGFIGGLRDLMWGPKIGDLIEARGTDNVLGYLLRGQGPCMVDLKKLDTSDRLERRIKRYAHLGDNAPDFVTVSGVLREETIRRVVAQRGRKMKIIIVPLLSDSDDAYCLETFRAGMVTVLVENIRKAIRAGADGITCPAYLLGIPLSMPEMEERLIIATGIRSWGVARDNHQHPLPPDVAVRMGATHFVIGREVTQAQDPREVLRSIVAHIR